LTPLLQVATAVVKFGISIIMHTQLFYPNADDENHKIPEVLNH